MNLLDQHIARIKPLEIERRKSIIFSPKFASRIRRMNPQGTSTNSQEVSVNHARNRSHLYQELLTISLAAGDDAGGYRALFEEEL